MPNIMVEEAYKRSGTLLPKHSSSISISNRLSAVQRKVFNILILNARNEIFKDKSVYSISVLELRNKLGIPRHDKNNTYLKKKIEELMHVVVKFDMFKKDKSVAWTAAPLLAGAQVQNGVLRYSFSQFLSDQLLDPKLYTILDLIIIQGLTSKYSIALYENLKDGAEGEFPLISIPFFKELVGVEEDKYGSITDLKKRVIDAAVVEINEKTDINVSYELIKSGRNYEYIKFKTKPSKKLNKEEYLAEITKKSDALKKVFLNAQMYATDKKENQVIVTIEDVEYRIKNEKVVIVAKTQRGTRLTLEFATFEDAKLNIQKNLI